MNHVITGGTRPLVFFGNRDSKKQSRTARNTPYGQGLSTAGGASSSRQAIETRREPNENLSPEEQAFRRKLEECLMYIYGNQRQSLLPKVPQAEKMFLRFYQEVYPQKMAERKRLRQLLVQKQESLEAAQSREQSLGPVARWPGWSGAVVGLGLESAIHLSSMGVLLPVLPPGTVTALSAAVGKWAGEAGSPQRVESRMQEIEGDLEDLDVYLSNLINQKALIDKRRSHRADTGNEPYRRHSVSRNPFAQVSQPGSSTRRRRRARPE